MNINPIKNEQDYQQSLIEVDKLWEAAPGSEAHDKLDILVTLIEAFEKKQYFIDTPDPIEAIKFRMEQQGLVAADLVPIIGQRSRVSEVLNRKRKLSMSMIRNLHAQLNIPLESLIMDYQLASS